VACFARHGAEQSAPAAGAGGSMNPAAGGTGAATAGGGVLGDPGCGLDAAAFCDPFDAPSAAPGRSGELDARKWSGGRMQPQAPTGSGNAFAIGPATIGDCRAGLP